MDWRIWRRVQTRGQLPLNQTWLLIRKKEDIELEHREVNFINPAVQVRSRNSSSQQYNQTEILYE